MSKDVEVGTVTFGRGEQQQLKRVFGSRCQGRSLFQPVLFCMLLEVSAGSLWKASWSQTGAGEHFFQGETPRFILRKGFSQGTHTIMPFRSVEL